MKPIVLHSSRNLTPAEKRKRAEEEDVYRVERLGLVPPKELSRRAKKHFEQIAEVAFWLDELSADLLACYCDAYDKWLLTVESMKNTDEVIITQNAKGELVAKQNPYRTALRTYASIMSEMSAKLAISNVDRLRLTLPGKDKKEDVNPFEMFMESPAVESEEVTV